MGEGGVVLVLEELEHTADVVVVGSFAELNALPDEAVRGKIVLYDVPNYRYLAYHFATNHAAKIIKRGTILEF